MTVAQSEAFSKGLKSYTGSVCKRCGGTERSVKGSHCIPCHRKTNTAWWESHPEIRRAKINIWRANNPEKTKAQNASWRSRNKPRLKERLDATFYNLLPGDRIKVYEFQNGKDPISGAPLSDHAHMDHCHKTGLIRGLLNPMTNKFLVDNEVTLRAMLAYILDPPAPHALGGKVFGLLGQAKHKRKMRYGPDGSPTPHPRTQNPVSQKGTPK